MRRLEDSIERKWADHDRLDRNIERLHASILEQKGNIDKLLGALRDLIDRIPPKIYADHRDIAGLRYTYGPAASS